MQEPMNPGPLTLKDTLRMPSTNATLLWIFEYDPANVTDEKRQWGAGDIIFNMPPEAN
jgi:hypothetical protein